MFDRFTDRARKVMGLSRQEAQRFNHDYIGTEHILLGLIQEGSGVAADVLRNLDVDPALLRRDIENRAEYGTTMVTMGQLPFTPMARRALELALEEASNLGHSYIGTEHLLLGLLRQDEGIAAEALRGRGLRFSEARDEVTRLLGGAEAPEREGPHRAAKRPPRMPFDLFSDRAHKVMGLSRQEALRLHHDYIGTEQILLGLILEWGGGAADVLKRLGVDREQIRQEVEKLVTPGNARVTAGALPFTPRAKVVIELALEEAGNHGQDDVRTEHLLLALIREELGIAAEVLRKLGIRVENVRKELDPGTAALTKRAHRAMRMAREEADRFRHDRVGAEHILLGIIRGEEAGGGELTSLLLRTVSARVGQRTTRGTQAHRGRVPLGPSAVTVMDLATEEARAYRHEWIGIGHLIVGLIREGGLAAEVLAAAGIRLEDAREDLGMRGGTAAGSFRSNQPSTATDLAQLEAKRLCHDCVDTGHVLLGLLATGGAACALLRKLGIDPGHVRAETEKRMTKGTTIASAEELPFTPSVKRALELASQQAKGEVKDEHVLLGLLREGAGTAAQVLADLGVTADAIRNAIDPGPPAPPE